VPHWTICTGGSPFLFAFPPRFFLWGASLEQTAGGTATRTLALKPGLSFRPVTGGRGDFGGVVRARGLIPTQAPKNLFFFSDLFCCFTPEKKTHHRPFSLKPDWADFSPPGGPHQFLNQGVGTNYPPGRLFFRTPAETFAKPDESLFVMDTTIT